MVEDNNTGSSFVCMLIGSNPRARMCILEQIMVQWEPPVLYNGALIGINTNKGSIPHIIDKNHDILKFNVKSGHISFFFPIDYSFLMRVNAIFFATFYSSVSPTCHKLVPYDTPIIAAHG